jgi:hypothetical protein
LRDALLKIAFLSNIATSRVVKDLLSPWVVYYTSVDKADIVIRTEATVDKNGSNAKTIIIPSNCKSFVSETEKTGIEISQKPSEEIEVETSNHLSLQLKPQKQYLFSGKEVGESITPYAIEAHNCDCALLTIDIINEYNQILEKTLNARCSRVYSMTTSLPIPYTIAPKRIKNLLLKTGTNGHVYSDYSDKLPMDALRLVLVKVIEELTKKKIEKKTWHGKRYAIILTHDVETKKGLQTAIKFRKLEQRYGLSSAWYVPSEHYELEIETIRSLCANAEIGAHDTKHDGKLHKMSNTRLCERFTKARQKLKELSGQDVTGFRAPLLQHNFRIIESLRAVGYTYDSSIPTWEPRHPYTMKPHGIGTTFPINISGLTEVPVTLTQDHQLLYVLGLSPKKTIEKWLEMIVLIKDLGGICTFLVHPDYKFGDNLDSYEDLLTTIASESEVFRGLPLQIAFETEVTF